MVDKIVEKGIDITEGYEKWLKVGFAIADALGEDGRDAFHKVSQFYSNYDYTECEKQYSKCVNGKGSGITYKTLFYLAGENNIDLSEFSRELFCAKNANVPSDTNYENSYIYNV